MTADKLENLLKGNQGGELHALVKRAKSMSALADTLTAALPAEFAGSIVAANIRENGRLVVISRSSAWTARLRFETETLARAGSSKDISVTAVVVRVAHTGA